MKKLVIIPILILISLIFISCNNDDKNDSVINLTTNTYEIITTPNSKTDAPILIIQVTH